MLWVLCPLLVTAKYFLLLLTIMFNGKSPKGKLLPTGVNDQPFGRLTRLSSSCCKVCACMVMVKNKQQQITKDLIYKGLGKNNCWKISKGLLNDEEKHLTKEKKSRTTTRNTTFRGD